MCHGSTATPLTTLIADTILEHGTGWAWRYYAKRLTRWELDFFMGTPQVGQAMVARAMYERLTQA